MNEIEIGKVKHVENHTYETLDKVIKKKRRKKGKSKSNKNK